MKRLLAVLLLAALAGGCGGGGAKEAGPVPTAKSQPSTTKTTSTTAQPVSDDSSSTTTSAEPPLCTAATSTVTLSAQQGAAGTISTVWRITNKSTAACRSYGYPGMDFHSAHGWLGVRVHRGGLAEIDAKPTSVVVGPGEAFYFVSFWGDADTDAGPCARFDDVEVTLPDNFTSVLVRTRGCLNPGDVKVGPVTSRPPS